MAPPAIVIPPATHPGGPVIMAAPPTAIPAATPPAASAFPKLRYEFFLSLKKDINFIIINAITLTIVDL